MPSRNIVDNLGRNWTVTVWSVSGPRARMRLRFECTSETDVLAREKPGVPGKDLATLSDENLLLFLEEASEQS